MVGGEGRPSNNRRLLQKLNLTVLWNRARIKGEGPERTKGVLRGWLGGGGLVGMGRRKGA